MSQTFIVADSTEFPKKDFVPYEANNWATSCPT